MLSEQHKGQAGNSDEDRARHSPIESEQVEPRADRRLGRRRPFKQMTPRDQQPDQGPSNRVAHQPRLMSKKRDQENGLD